jgi:FAD/FMN-containing dehydrogenase
MLEKAELIKIVGKGNVYDKPLELDAYAKDESFAKQVRPRFLVRPKNPDEVQKIVNLARKTLTSLVTA